LEDRAITDDGVGLWFARSGTGTPLILNHGGPGAWDELEPVAAMLDADVIRWDQRGAGRSDVRGPYSVVRFIADMECIRKKVGIDRWIVAGHSWGAGLALRYAIAHPDRVDALICISGTDLDWPRHRPTYHAERLRRVGPNGNAFEADFVDRSRAPRYAAWDRFIINREANTAINAELAREDQAALAASCRALEIDALIVHGAEDPRPLAGPRDLAAALPRAALKVLPNVGHYPWAEGADLLRDELRAFLKNVGNRS
jgi:proline iminopeptidase